MDDPDRWDRDGFLSRFVKPAPTLEAAGCACWAVLGARGGNRVRREQLSHSPGDADAGSNPAVSFIDAELLIFA
jgi:hypothetical protein